MPTVSPRRPLEARSLVALGLLGTATLALLLPLLHGVLPPQASSPAYFASPLAAPVARLAERSPHAFRAAAGAMVLLGAAAMMAAAPRSTIGAAAMMAAARARGAGPMAATLAAAVLALHPAIAHLLVTPRDATLLAAIPLGLLSILPSRSSTPRAVLSPAAWLAAVLLHPAAVAFGIPFLANVVSHLRASRDDRGIARAPASLLSPAAAVFLVALVVTAHTIAADPADLPALAGVADVLGDTVARLVAAPASHPSLAGLCLAAVLAAGILVPDGLTRVLALWLGASIPAGFLCATQWGLLVVLLLPAALLAARGAHALAGRPRLAGIPPAAVLVIAVGLGAATLPVVRDGRAILQGLRRTSLELDRLSHEEPDAAARFAFLLESPAFETWIRGAFGEDRASRIPHLLQPRRGPLRFLPEQRREFLEAQHFRGTRVYDVGPRGVVPATAGSLLPGVDWVSEFRFVREVRPANGPLAQWSCLLDPSSDAGHACVPPDAALSRAAPSSAPGHPWGEGQILSVMRRPVGWWVDVEVRGTALLVWTGSASHFPGQLTRLARPLGMLTRLPPPPGTVRVDGRPVPTVPADAVFAGIVLEEGTHQIELQDPIPRSR